MFANPDQWDGYQPARDRVFDAIEDGPVEDGVRVSNERISRLRALMPLGTPIEIVG